MEFSEIYSLYDQQEEQNLKFRRNLEDKISKDYLTFYEQIQKHSGLHPLTLSLIFGSILFLLHFTSTFFEKNVSTSLIIDDFSFFLAALNAVGLYLIFMATEKLREFIVNLIQLTKQDDDEASDLFLEKYKKKFLGWRTIFLGVIFGFVNSILAYVFGINYSQHGQDFLLSTFLLQVFTVGFIGGITINATFVIQELINDISIKENINLAYFYPDKCAGTLIIGNILFLFSIHFMIIGVLIFLFIHNYDWTNLAKDNYNHYVYAIIVFWKIFPFLLSGIIFFLPIKKLNAILREYKIFEQLKVRRRMNYLTGIIISLESDNKESKDKIEILDYHYQKLFRIDKEIEEMNTWPYNLKYRATFLGIFLPILIGIILEISKKIISNQF